MADHELADQLFADHEFADHELADHAFAAADQLSADQASPLPPAGGAASPNGLAPSVTAVSEVSSPAPSRSPGRSTAPARRVALTSSGSSPGDCASSTAAAPLTTAVAWLVPLPR